MDSLRVVRGVRLPPTLALVWFVFLLGIPLALASDHASVARWTLVLGGLVVFLALYLTAFQMCGWMTLLPISGMFALGAVGMHWNVASMAYFIFGSTFFGWAFRDRASLAMKLLVAYLAAMVIVGYATGLHWNVLLMPVLMSALVGYSQVRFASQYQMARRLRLAYDEVERLAKVAERERIARDLHDVLGHSLSLIVLKSELASKLTPIDPERAACEIRDVERIARESLGDVREAVAGYRGAGIAAEIEHARDVFASAGIALECEAAELRLPAHYEGVLALAIREAVTNVVRHAGASSVRLILRLEGSTCRFEIVDDGRSANGLDGAGLRGMRERVEALGGVLERSFENGTRIAVSLPLGATP